MERDKFESGGGADLVEYFFAIAGYRVTPGKFRARAKAKAVTTEWASTPHHNTQACVNNQRNEAMTEQKRKYTDEEIKARFERAEAFQNRIEDEFILRHCPEEIVDKFRVGAKKTLFRTLLISPEMELEEGIWSVQSSPETDEELGYAPHELVLEAALHFPYKYRIRVRTEAPTPEVLVEEPSHFMIEPKTWQEVVDWATSIKALGIVEGFEDNAGRE